MSPDQCQPLGCDGAEADDSELDVPHVLPVVHVPTLVVYRVGFGDDPDEGRYMAERIPHAELLELSGEDHGWWGPSGPDR